MIDQRIVDRAETLAEMAPDDSVTAEVLAGREGRFTTATPLAAPPVTYLEDTEAPAYVLTNKKRGIGLGSKRNTTAPAGERRTVILVTGRRTLCLVGGESSDDVIEVPHESVAKAVYSTGFRGHRIGLRTPRQQYHCWIHRNTKESLLEASTEFIEARQPEDPEPLDGDDASRLTYRGRPVTREQLADQSKRSADDRSLTYRGQPLEDS